jgi:hypothetical protein
LWTGGCRGVKLSGEYGCAPDAVLPVSQFSRLRERLMMTQYMDFAWPIFI